MPGKGVARNRPRPRPRPRRVRQTARQRREAAAKAGQVVSANDPCMFPMLRVMTALVRLACFLTHGPRGRDGRGVPVSTIIQAALGTLRIFIDTIRHIGNNLTATPQRATAGRDVSDTYTVVWEVTAEIGGFIDE
ncbi:hypothetical protein KIPB_012864, partial [Kipferlia bialata]|eukprot:g12864.t1